MTAARGQELVAKLEAVTPDVLVTADPRAATPPCLLVVPPLVYWDGNCSGTATWLIYALAPGPGNLDAWSALDELLTIAMQAVPVEQHQFIAYSLSPDAPLLPAYRIQFTEGVDIPTWPLPNQG